MDTKSRKALQKWGYPNRVLKDEPLLARGERAWLGNPVREVVFDFLRPATRYRPAFQDTARLEY